MIGLGHEMGLRVVAEGVESPVHAGQLRRAGCDSGQGFLFGAAMPAPELENVIYSQLANLERPAFGRQPQPSADATPSSG